MEIMAIDDSFALELHRTVFAWRHGNLFIEDLTQINALRDNPTLLKEYIVRYFNPHHPHPAAIWTGINRVYMSSQLRPIETITLRRSCPIPEDLLPLTELPSASNSKASTSKTLEKLKLVSPLFRGTFDLSKFRSWCSLFDRQYFESVEAIFHRSTLVPGGKADFYTWLEAAENAFKSISDIVVPIEIKSFTEKRLESNFMFIVLQHLVTFLNKSGLLPFGAYLELSGGTHQDESVKSKSDIYISLIRYKYYPSDYEPSDPNATRFFQYRTEEMDKLYPTIESTVLLFFEMKKRNLRVLVTAEVNDLNGRMTYVFDISKKSTLILVGSLLRQTNHYNISERVQYCFLSDCDFTIFLFLDVKGDEAGLREFVSSFGQYRFSHLDPDNSKYGVVPYKYLIFKNGICFDGNEIITLQSFVAYLLLYKGEKIITGSKASKDRSEADIFELLKLRLAKEDEKKVSSIASSASSPYSSSSLSSSTSSRISNVAVQGSADSPIDSIRGHNHAARTGMDPNDKFNAPVYENTRKYSQRENDSYSALTKSGSGKDTLFTGEIKTDDFSSITTPEASSSSLSFSQNLGASIYLELSSEFASSLVQIDRECLRHYEYIKPSYYYQFQTMKVKTDDILTLYPELREECFHPECLNEEFVFLKVCNELALTEAFTVQREEALFDLESFKDVEDLVASSRRKLMFECLVTRTVNKYNEDHDDKLNVPKVLWNGFMNVDDGLDISIQGFFMISQYIKPDYSIYNITDFPDPMVILSEEQRDDATRQLNVLGKALGISHNDLELGNNIIYHGGKIYFVDFAEAAVQGIQYHGRRFDPSSDTHSVSMLEY